MKTSQWPFVAGIVTLGLLGGLLGGLNLMWSRQAQFPIYGYIADIVIVGVFIYLFVNVRRMKAESTDEFHVAKKRLAAQTGIILGFVIYAVSNALPLFFPHTSRAFLASMDGAEEGFIIGRVFGMAPFVIGLLIGQVVSWARYK